MWEATDRTLCVRMVIADGTHSAQFDVLGQCPYCIRCKVGMVFMWLKPGTACYNSTEQFIGVLWDRENQQPQLWNVWQRVDVRTDDWVWGNYVFTCYDRWGSRSDAGKA